MEEAKEVQSRQKESSYDESKLAVSRTIAVPTTLKQQLKQSLNVAKYHDWDSFVEKEPQIAAVGKRTLTKIKQDHASVIPPPTYADQRNEARSESQMFKELQKTKGKLENLYAYKKERERQMHSDSINEIDNVFGNNLQKVSKPKASSVTGVKAKQTERR